MLQKKQVNCAQIRPDIVRAFFPLIETIPSAMTAGGADWNAIYTENATLAESFSDAIKNVRVPNGKSLEATRLPYELCRFREEKRRRIIIWLEGEAAEMHRDDVASQACQSLALGMYGTCLMLPKTSKANYLADQYAEEFDQLYSGNLTPHANLLTRCVPCMYDLTFDGSIAPIHKCTRCSNMTRLNFKRCEKCSNKCRSCQRLCDTYTECTDCQSRRKRAELEAMCVVCDHNPKQVADKCAKCHEKTLCVHCMATPKTHNEMCDICSNLCQTCWKLPMLPSRGICESCYNLQFKPLPTQKVTTQQPQKKWPAETQAIQEIVVQQVAQVASLQTKQLSKAQARRLPKNQKWVQL